MGKLPLYDCVCVQSMQREFFGKRIIFVLTIPDNCSIVLVTMSGMRGNANDILSGTTVKLCRIKAVDQKYQGPQREKTSYFDLQFQGISCDGILCGGSQCVQ